VDSFPHKGHKQQVSEDHANYPAWSRSANELYFWNFRGNARLIGESSDSLLEALIG